MLAAEQHLDALLSSSVGHSKLPTAYQLATVTPGDAHRCRLATRPLSICKGDPPAALALNGSLHVRNNTPPASSQSALRRAHPLPDPLQPRDARRNDVASRQAARAAAGRGGSAWSGAAASEQQARSARGRRRGAGEGAGSPQRSSAVLQGERVRRNCPAARRRPTRRRKLALRCRVLGAAAQCPCRLPYCPRRKTTLLAQQP